MARYSAGPT